MQRAIVAHLKVRAAKSLFWYAIPNGGWRSPVEAAIMKSTGTRAGVPDLAFLHEGRAYFLEIKADDRSRPTEAQLSAMAAITDAGGHACIGVGVDGCLFILEQWGLLKGTLQ